jgi:hypothetical protein
MIPARIWYASDFRGTGGEEEHGQQECGLPIKVLMEFNVAQIRERIRSDGRPPSRPSGRPKAKRRAG